MSRRSKRKRRHEAATPDPHLLTRRAILNANPAPGAARQFAPLPPGAKINILHTQTGRVSSFKPNLQGLPRQDAKQRAEDALTARGLVPIMWPSVLETLKDIEFPIEVLAPGTVHPMSFPHVGQETMIDRLNWAPQWAEILARANIWEPARDYVLKLAMQDREVWDAFDSLVMLSTTARREHAETQTFSDLKDLVEDAAWDLWKKYEETIKLGNGVRVVEIEAAELAEYVYKEIAASRRSHPVAHRRGDTTNIDASQASWYSRRKKTT